MPLRSTSLEPCLVRTARAGEVVASGFRRRSGLAAAIPVRKRRDGRSATAAATMTNLNIRNSKPAKLIAR